VNILIVGTGHMGQILEKELSGKLCKKRIQEMTSEDIRGFDVVVNTAGKTDLPYCENNPLDAFENNVQAPLMLLRMCQNELANLIHFSSGCIWKGPYNASGSPFSPESPPTPACFYSWTKAAAEAMLLKEAFVGLHILRPRQVFSSSVSPRNTLTKLLRYPDLLDTPNSMTSDATIVKAIKRICADKLEFKSKRVWNLYDIGVTSPYKVGMMLHDAGLRLAPKILEKNALDSWHKPQRVDAVMCDIYMEKFVEPGIIEGELNKAINGLVKNLNGATIK